MLFSLQCCFPCNIFFLAFCFPFVMLLSLPCCFPFALYKIDHTWCALDQADTKSRFKFSDNKLGRGVLGPRRSKSGSQQRFVFQIWNLASNPLDNFPLYDRCILDLEPSIQTFGKLSFVFWICIWIKPQCQLWKLNFLFFNHQTYSFTQFHMQSNTLSILFLNLCRSIHFHLISSPVHTWNKTGYVLYVLSEKLYCPFVRKWNGSPH